MCEQNDYELTS